MHKVKDRSLRLAIKGRIEILDRQGREQPDRDIQPDNAQHQQHDACHQTAGR